MKLREYQSRAIGDAMQAIRAGARSPVIVAPTGAGKTVIGASIASRAKGLGIWVSHREELILQSKSTIESMGKRCGVLAPWASKMDGDERVHVASLQTIVARPELDLSGYAYAIIDECHHIVSATWSTVLARLSCPKIGLTATPARSDGVGLAPTFDALIVAATYSQLIADGSLVPARIYAPAGTEDALAIDPVAAYYRFLRDQSVAIFAGSVIEAQDICARLPGSEMITGETPDRAAIIDRFRSGATRVLVNVHVLTEGFDAPRMTGVILARPIGHPSTYLQICGRAMRPSTGKEICTIVDLCGSVHAHGNPGDDREYSLDGDAIKGKSAKCLTTCPSCYAAFYRDRFVNRICPVCAEELPRPEARGVLGKELYLLGEGVREATAEEINAIAKRLGDRLFATRGEKKSMWNAYQQKFSKGQAIAIFTKRYGHSPWEI